MTRKITSVVLLVALLGTGLFWFALQPERPAWLDALVSPTLQPAPAEADARGPHGGWLLTRGDLTVELKIYEKGMPPEFRLWTTRNGAPVPPAEVQAEVDLHRIGGFVDHFAFKPTGDFLRGDGVVEEPHSFDVSVHVKHKGTEASWKFPQIEMRSTIRQAMADDAGIVVETAGPETLQSTVTLVGEIGLHERRLAHVVPRVDAVVREVYKHLGDRVAQGEAIALLESRELADAKSAYLEALKKAEPVFLDMEREEQLFRDVGKMLKILDQNPDLDTLDKSLDQFLLGEARSTMVSAYARLIHMTSVYQREKELFAKKISSESEFLLAREEFESARARYSALREKIEFDSRLVLLEKRHLAEKAELAVLTAEQKLAALGLSEPEIRRFTEHEDEEEKRFTEYPLKSPLAGEIIEKHLAPGEAVKKADTVIVVADLSELWVNIAVPAKDLNAVRLGQKVRLREEHLSLEATGKLTYLGSVIDATTRTVTGRVVIQNPQKRWKPGMYVTVHLTRDERKVPLAVRAEALQTLRDWNVVFVKYGEDYQARPVELGESDGTWVEIKKGLRKGEPYVSKNSFAVKAEIGKSAASHDH